MVRTTTLPPQLTIQDHAHPLTGSTQDYDPLLDLIGKAAIAPELPSG
jgi:hypothetical protein